MGKDPHPFLLKEGEEKKESNAPQIIGKMGSTYDLIAPSEGWYKGGRVTTFTGIY